MSDDRADWRAEIGRVVGARLADDSRIMRIPSATLEIFVARDFLTETECATLIRLIDAERTPSLLLAPSEDPEFRTSESCNLDPGHPMIRQVEAKLSELTGIDPQLGETIQGQRYAVGQQFKPHHDFFYEDQNYWEIMKTTGGQRTWTAMIFLNVPGEGGQTAFPAAGVKVTPRAGNLLIWNNMDANGQPNLYSLHEGMPVTGGVKYIITKWHREGPWSPTPFAGY